MYQNKINKGYLLLSNKMIDIIHRKYSESQIQIIFKIFKIFESSDIFIEIAPSFCYRILQAE